MNDELGRTMSRMRFLYGDSLPFEGGYDVLDTLRHWVQASAELLQTVNAIEASERGVGKRAQEQLHAISAVDGFFDTVVQRIVEEAARAGEPDLMAPHARELVERVKVMAATVREQSAASLDGDQRSVAANVEGQVASLTERLGAYLLTGPLPINGWELTLSHADGPAAGRVSLHYPEAIDGHFALDLARDPNWSNPKRVGDLCADVVLEVGVKKAFLRSTLNPEVAPLDELYLTYLELGEASMNLRLSRRPEQGETFLIIDADFSGDSVVGKIRRPGDGSETPHPSPGSDHSTLRQLHAGLRQHARPLTRHEGVLERVALDGEARPVRGELIRDMLGRIVGRLAPTALQVHAHSPNPAELSLKREHDDGRREELYLKISELQEPVALVADHDLTLFAEIPFLIEGRELPSEGSEEASSAAPEAVESAAAAESAAAESEPPSGSDEDPTRALSPAAGAKPVSADASDVASGSTKSERPSLELVPVDDLASVEVDLASSEISTSEGSATSGEASKAKTGAPESKVAKASKPAAPRKPKAPSRKSERPSAPPRRRSERPSAPPRRKSERPSAPPRRKSEAPAKRPSEAPKK